MCWGDSAAVNSASELMRDGASAPQITCTPSTDSATGDRCSAVIASPTGLGWDSVSVGVWHSCGTTGGEVYCWGNPAWFNGSGKAHLHPQHDTYNAPRLAQPDNARIATAGYWHTCWTYGTETAPKVICTGDNSLKQARWKKKTLR